MKLILKIALRNVFRQKRRSLLTGMMMSVGFALFSTSIAWIDGSYNTIITNFTENKLGHLQIHVKGYLDSPSIYKRIKSAYALGDSILNIEGVRSWTPRILAGGLGMVGENTAAVQIIAVDPAREDLSSKLNKKVIEGSYLPDVNSKKVLIGKDLAKIISAEIGDTIVFLSQSADGSIANDQYEISGIVSTGNPSEDRIYCYMDIKDAWNLFYMQGSCHEISILINSIDDIENMKRKIGSILPEDLEIKTWKEFARSFYKAMQADRAGDMVFRIIIMLIISVGIFNSVLMAVLERTREYGLLKSLGMKPSEIFGLIYSELFILSSFSVFAGSVIATLAIWFLSYKGLTLGEGFSYGGMIFSELKATFSIRAFYEPLLLLVLSVAAVTFFPALKASNTDPIVSMRDF
ncbi:ABC transporter permease [candidate division WOR-3 bacterium]|nr:ABC transporter permease [candidate division WOR-3 bacterium]